MSMINARVDEERANESVMKRELFSVLEGPHSKPTEINGKTPLLQLLSFSSLS